VSPHRSRVSTARLRSTYEQTLEALDLRFEQLEAAVSSFDPDLDERTLSACWNSHDPEQRNRADAVLSSFEKTYMLLMDLIGLAAKLARRTGVIEGEQSPIDALRSAGVLSRPDQEALALQRTVRNESQHIYVELTMSSLREAVRAQMHATPRIVAAITAWVDSLDSRAKSDLDTPDLKPRSRQRTGQGHAASRADAPTP
jgi:hypothetical protein